MSIPILITIYIIIALVHIGIFYAWDPTNTPWRESLELRAIVLGLLFPITYTVLLIINLCLIPCQIVDVLRKLKNKNK